MIRRMLHARGYRYRVQYPVPGLSRRSIDIAFSRLLVAVFIDGCFWHRCPLHGTAPLANGEWWRAKLEANVVRDRATDEHLRALGWRVVRCWEHENPEESVARIVDVLEQAVGRS